VGKVERRRRQRGESVFSSPQGRGLGRGHALSQNFLRLCGQNRVFSWTLGAKFRFFFYDQNSIEIHQGYKDCHGN